MFILDIRSVGMDPAIVKDPDIFDPTRWFEHEVQNRRGTPAEILDHPLYKAPFSAGARKCPGNRVASYEAKILLSQLVLDWKISIAEIETDSVGGSKQPKSWRDIAYSQGLTIQPEVPELSFGRRQ
jgi:cytochrome P450